MSDETKVNSEPTPEAKSVVVNLPYPIPDTDVKYLKDPLPDPVFPTMAMPPDPKAPGNNGADIIRPDCEGYVATLPPPENSPVPPPANGKLRIMIGVPILAVTYEFLESFLRFWTELTINRSDKYEISYHFAYRKPVHMAEEYLVQTAIYNKCTHILFMDDDIYDVSKADLDKLVDANKDVIGGVMHASRFPHAMCVFRRFERERKVIDMPVDNSLYRLYEIPCNCPTCNTAQAFWDAPFCPACGGKLNNLIQQADLIPFAFTLMNLDVFKKIKWPWFHCTTKYPTDSWFADRLIEAGMTEYAHMGVRLNHAGVTDVTKPHYQQMGMEASRKRQAVVTITPEQMSVHQMLLANKMSEAEKSLRARPPFVGEKGLVVNEISNKELTLVTHGK